MSIRNAAKAVILSDNKILLDRYLDPVIGEYYSIPGGGQHKYEALEEAVVRECLEETGYRVIPQSYIALYEEIFLDEAERERFPHYSHKILHIFKCSLCDDKRVDPCEQDSSQLDSVWVDLNDLSKLRILPAVIGENINRIIASDSPIYLGTHFI